MPYRRCLRYWGMQLPYWLYSFCHMRARKQERHRRGYRFLET
jgi:hypothetical protein